MTFQEKLIASQKKETYLKQENANMKKVIQDMLTVLNVEVMRLRDIGDNINADTLVRRVKFFIGQTE